MDTFKFKRDDITEARKGNECGISLEGFTDLQEGDLLQVYDLVPIPKVLT